MSSVARNEPWRPDLRGSPFWALIVQIKEAHVQLLNEMANMDAITAGPFPGDDSFANARWRIGQASLRRRTTVARALDFLTSRSNNLDKLEQLRSLKAADQQMMRRSAQHVCAWTTKKIREDWRGYCDASVAIRMHMRCHILAERQALYPMFESLAQRRI